MAVVSITECTLLKGSAKSDSESPTAQRIFIVRFDAKPADWDEITGAAGLPVIGAAFKTGDSRQLKSLSPSSMGTVLEYLVTCDYGVPSLQAFDSNPLTRKDIIKGGGTSKDQPYFLDNSEDPQQVCTSAYEPFEKLPENTVGQWGITVTGNRASLDLVTWSQYMHPIKGCAINSDAVTVRGITFPAGTLKLVNIRFAPKTEGSYSYWEIEWELRLAPTWDQDIDDQGYFQLTDDGSGVVPIMAANGIDKVAKPFPLDGTGYAVEDVAGSDQAYLTFKPQPKKAFGVFSWTAAA